MTFAQRQTMTPTPGISCAEILIRAGATRAVVIPALQHEVGLTADEAGAAWEGALARMDAHLMPVGAAIRTAWR